MAEIISPDDEEMIMSLWDLVYDGGDTNQALAADLLTLGSMAAALLLDAAPLSPESWRWAESAGLAARGAAETMAKEAADIQRALSLLSRLPVPTDFEEEAEAFLAALRRQAADTAARRADAEEVAALMRMVREKGVRRMANAAEPILHPDAAAFLAAAGGEAEELAALRRMAAAEHLVHPATAAFLGYIAGETDALLARGEAMPAGELALAPHVEDAAVRVEESMATLAGRLRRGAAELAARPGEEALVAALHMQAASADAARATVEPFTASVRRFRAAAGGGGSAPPPAAVGCSSLRPKL
ncbi:unnamed protein product [Urochloa humidicola]